jgi:hypothetical protein
MRLTAPRHFEWRAIGKDDVNRRHRKRGDHTERFVTRVDDLVRHVARQDQREVRAERYDAAINVQLAARSAVAQLGA